LKEAARTKDGPLVADLAHKLKSPARSVGAMHLGGLCEELEKHGRTGDSDAIDVCFSRFQEELGKVQTYLREA
jgi:HPt (histidine-containing phosphotransfer) domain-containing protein